MLNTRALFDGTTDGARRFWQGVGAGLVCTLIWGGQAVVMRLSVVDGLTAVDVTVLRFVVAGSLLLPWALRERPFPVGLLGWRRGLVLAMLVGAPYSLVVVGGVAFAPALHSTVVTFGVIPIATTTFAYHAFGERPGLGQVTYLGLILSGLALFGWESLISGPAHAWQGYLLFVVAATMWAAFTTLSKLWRVDPLRATAVVAVLSLGIVPVGLVFPMQLTHVRIGSIAIQAGYLGVLATVLSTYLYTRTITLLGSVRASVIVALVPVATGLASPAVLGEWPTSAEIAGMVVVIVGVVLLVRHKPPSPATRCGEPMP